MDNLKLAWKDIEQGPIIAEGTHRIDLSSAIHAKSRGVMSKISKGLKYKSWFAFGGVILFAAALFVAPDFLTQLFIGIVLVVFIVGGVLINKESKLIKDEIDLSGNLKQTIKSFHDRVTQVLKYEERVGLTIYPVSASAGFLIGLGKGESEESIFSSWQGWVIFIVVIAIVTPLAHWMSKKLNKIAFGKYLNELQSEIEELEREETEGL